MKKFLFLLFILLVSCSKKDSPRPIFVLDHFEKNDIEKLDLEMGNLLEISSDEKSSLRFTDNSFTRTRKLSFRKKSGRYLRDKIGRIIYLNQSGQEIVESQELVLNDLFSYKLGALSETSLLEIWSLYNNDNLSFGSSQLSIKFGLVKKGRRVKNISLKISALDRANYSLYPLFYKNVLRYENELEDFEAGRLSRREKTYLARSEDLSPGTLANHFLSNKDILLEMNDFESEQQTFLEWKKEVKMKKTIVVITTPEKDYRFYIRPGLSFREILTEIDPTVTLTQNDNIVSLLNHERKSQKSLSNWYYYSTNSVTYFEAGDVLAISFSSKKELNKHRVLETHSKISGAGQSFDIVKRRNGELKLYVKLETVSHIVKERSLKVFVRNFDGVLFRMQIIEPFPEESCVVWENVIEDHEVDTYDSKNVLKKITVVLGKIEMNLKELKQRELGDYTLINNLLLITVFNLEEERHDRDVTVKLNSHQRFEEIGTIDNTCNIIKRNCHKIGAGLFKCRERSYLNYRTFRKKVDVTDTDTMTVQAIY